MAATIPYWRVLFYPDKPELNSSINVAKLIPQDSDGVAIGGSPTLAAEKQHDAIGYPLANVLDDVTTTYAVLAWAAADLAPAWISFQWALPTSVDRFLVRFNSTDTVYGTVLASNKVHILVQFSWNGTEWTTSANVGAQITAGNTDITIPAIRSSTTNPGIVHLAERGAGGIFGVVSEDSVAASGYPVAAYSRTTMDKVAYTTSEADGGYALNGLNPDNEYLVVAMDPTGPSPKNAIAWDRVKPIPSTKYLPSDDRFLAHRIRDPYLGPTMAMSAYVPSLYPVVIPYGGFNHWAGQGYTPITDTYEIFQNTQVFDLEIKGASNVTGMNFLGRSDYANPLSPGSAGFLGGGIHPSGEVADNVVVDSSVNYAAFTYEMVIITPAASETGGMIFQLGGLPNQHLQIDAIYSILATAYSGDSVTFRRSLVFDIREGNLTVRANLGGFTASVDRVVVALAPSTPVHVVVTYEESVEFKVYVNGVLAGTGAIPGAGRLYSAGTGADLASSSSALWYLENSADWNNYNGSYVAPSTSYNCNSGPLAMLDQFHLRTFNYGTQSQWFLSSKTSWAGAIAFFATYFEVKDATAVAALYDSYQNPTSFQVLPTQVGYSAQVEMDNPVQYLPLSESVQPAAQLRCHLGRRDNPFRITSGSGVLGANGNFVAGKTTYYCPSGDSFILSDRNVGVGLPFSIEFFMRSTDLSANRSILAFEGPVGYTNLLDLFVRTDGLFQLNLLTVARVSVQLVFPAYGSHVVQANTSYHVVLTYDPVSSGEANLYINGTLASTLVAASYPDVQGIYRVRLLQDSSGGASSTFRGYFAEFALYGSVLTADRVAAHYASRND